MAARVRRAKTARRGYGGDFQRQRAQWRPVVDSGGAFCHAAICLMASRHITPGTPWDLGHTPDRSRITGPEHRRCNRSEGARRGNRMRGARSRSRRPVAVRSEIVNVTVDGRVIARGLRTSRNW